MKVTKIDLPLVCPDVSEFMRPFPWRSPLCVVEAIKDIIIDKSVCDIGCAEGDILAKIAKYAKSAVGIEQDRNRYTVAQRRGLNVIVGNFYKCEIPKVDVYYTWTTPEVMVDTTEILFNKFDKFKLIVGGIGCDGKPSPSCMELADRYNGEVLEMLYLESSVLGHFSSQGTWYLVVLNKE